MRSRELPAFRSLRSVWPDAEVEEFEDHVVIRTAAGGISASGTATVLDEPPEHVGPWLLRAGGHDLLWEDRFGASPPLAVPAGHRLEVRSCFLHDVEMDAERPAGVRPLAPDEVEPAVRLLVRGGVPRSLARWQLEVHLRRVEEELASVLVTGPHLAPTGIVSVGWNGREARIQGLAVDPDHRRKGLGRKLLAGAATDWQGISFGLLYAVVEAGTAAEALMRDAGMRPVTAVYRITAA